MIKMSEQKTKKTKTQDEIKDEKYYDVLEFLEKSVDQKKLPKSTVLTFKEMIRDNKYVATYLRSLKKNLESINDYPQYQQKNSRKFSKAYDPNDFTHPNIDSIFWLNEIDPIKIIKKLVSDGLNREGKICDFKDSVNPQSKFGYCQSEYHNEDEDGDVRIKEELFLTLYCDDDTSKFDDNLPEYICNKCIENSDCDCEVSCDMD